jgi:DNA repair protein RecN (Recombination protein N)
MLTLLRISGFGLIDEVELPLGPGLTVITGETGAGKSMLLDAIALLRGGRATTDAIRAGRDDAQVEAVFDLPPEWDVRERLEADGRQVEDGLIVRRVVARSGRGRIHLGGGLAGTADLVRTVGALVDITSQHDQQSLMDPDSQLDIVDAFVGNRPLLREAKAAHETFVAAEQALATFDADARTRAAREDLLRFQLSEIEQAGMKVGEDEALKIERERIRGAEKFFGAFNRGEEALYSGDDAVAGRIAAVLRELSPLAPLDPEVGALVERLASAQAAVEDVGRELGRRTGGIRFDPERLAEIEERLFLIGRLIRKHGGSAEAVLARRDEMSRELADLGSFEEGLSERRKAVETARARLEAIAGQLAARRRTAAAHLGRRIDETLHELGLPEAHVTVDLEDREDVGPKGRDRVRFLFAPNPGEQPRPLARIASGGELSRVMLAVKRALAQADQVLTYIFDEVDTGVGGGTAEVIGRKLKAIAAERQVLAVTHLPQIAAFADHHVKVSKETTGGRTCVKASVLEGASRAAEIARMLGGEPPSKKAKAHAGDMLRRAGRQQAA